MKMLIVALLSFAGCGPAATGPRLWLAPNGSDTNLYLSDAEPYPF